jgi:hypothetical protein
MQRACPSLVGLLAGGLFAAAFVVAGGGCSGAPLGGAGAGGRPGTGGAPCTTANGCLKGSGGGSGVSGILGSGGYGTGGIDGVVCDQIGYAYAQALPAALACTPGAPNQCQALVATYPTNCPGSACGAQEYVNDGTTLEALRQKWLGTCSAVDQTCIDVGCGVEPSVCLPTSPGASTGTCVPLGSDAGASYVPDGGESCEQLAADYSTAVTAALACNPVAPNQCQTYVTTTPSGCDPNCGVSVFVNDASNVNAALQRWISQCVGTVACPLIYCKPPNPAQGTCVSDGTASGGVCNKAHPTTM